MGTLGTQLAEDASGPRVSAELMKMNRMIGELIAAQKLTEKKVDEVHKVIFVGNRNPGILQWLLQHDNQISRISGENKLKRIKKLRIYGASGLGAAFSLLTLKLIIWSVTGHWPTIP